MKKANQRDKNELMDYLEQYGYALSASDREVVNCTGNWDCGDGEVCHGLVSEETACTADGYLRIEDGKIIEGGMEGQIKRQYESDLSSMLLIKKESMESLSENQLSYVQERIKNTLELSKNQYYS